MNRVRHSLSLAVSLLALTAPAAVRAQEDTPAPSEGAATLEDIVVTARRREESVIDVPVAVSALSAKMLDAAHVTDVTQIAQMTPQLLIAPASGGGGGTISIRGVGSSYLDPGIEQSVGVLVDNVPVGRGRFIMSSQFDLQQVRGAEGTAGAVLRQELARRRHLDHVGRSDAGFLGHGPRRL